MHGLNEYADKYYEAVRGTKISRNNFTLCPPKGLQL